MFNNLNFRLSTSVAHNISRRGSEKFKQVLGASRGRPIFTAVNIRQDPVSKKVLRIVDWNDPTHYLEQSTPANQCAMPIGHTDFAGQLCLTFSGVEWYQSNKIEKWPPTHDGTGSSLYWTGTATANATLYFLCATMGNSSTTKGFLIAHNGTGGQACRYFIGSGSASVFAAQPAGFFTLGIPLYLEASYNESAPTKRVLYNRGTIASSGGTLTTPGTGNPVAALTLGAGNAGVFPFVGRWTALLTPPFVDAVIRSLVQQYQHETHGIAFA